MRTLCILLLCLMALVATATPKPRPYKGYYYVPYDPTTMHFGLTPQEAEQRLVRWMNNPAITLRFIGVGTSCVSKLENRTSWPVYDPHWNPGWGLSYLFEDNLGKMYVVAIVPIELWEYTDFEADMTPYPEDSSQWLPKEQRDSIVHQFITSRVPNLLEGDYAYNKHGRVFYQGYNGLPYNRLAIVRVHPTLGVVTSCSWRKPGEPSGLNTTPSLSREQAIQLALSYVYQLEGTVSAEVELEPQLLVFADELGIVRLLWITLVGYRAVQYPGALATSLGKIIGVDAHTGDVLDFDAHYGGSVGGVAKGKGDRSVRRKGSSSFGKQARPALRFRVMRASFGETPLQLMALPPLQVGRRAYVWVGWLKLPLFAQSQVGLTYASGVVDIDYGGQRWRARVGSDVLLRNGLTHRLGAPVLNIRGRVYLPAEALHLVTGLKVEVDGQVLKMGR
ncbi:MAG: hypothetical protein HPY54_16510 [Chthonomonadetes bacterium]|nr:hypothetical protein [Chthonomonadetes bacterium]